MRQESGKLVDWYGFWVADVDVRSGLVSDGEILSSSALIYHSG